MWCVLMGETRGDDDELIAADGEAEVGLGQSSGEGGCCCWGRSGHLENLLKNKFNY